MYDYVGRETRRCGGTCGLYLRNDITQLHCIALRTKRKKSHEKNFPITSITSAYELIAKRDSKTSRSPSCCRSRRPKTELAGESDIPYYHDVHDVIIFRKYYTCRDTQCAGFTCGKTSCAKKKKKTERRLYARGKNLQ